MFFFGFRERPTSAAVLPGAPHEPRTVIRPPRSRAFPSVRILPVFTRLRRRRRPLANARQTNQARVALRAAARALALASALEERKKRGENRSVFYRVVQSLGLKNRLRRAGVRGVVFVPYLRTRVVRLGVPRVGPAFAAIRRVVPRFAGRTLPRKVHVTSPQRSAADVTRPRRGIFPRTVRPVRTPRRDGRGGFRRYGTHFERQATCAGRPEGHAKVNRRRQSRKSRKRDLGRHLIIRRHNVVVTEGAHSEV